MRRNRLIPTNRNVDRMAWSTLLNYLRFIKYISNSGECRARASFTAAPGTRQEESQSQRVDVRSPVHVLSQRTAYLRLRARTRFPARWPGPGARGTGASAALLTVQLRFHARTPSLRLSAPSRPSSNPLAIPEYACTRAMYHHLYIMYETVCW